MPIHIRETGGRETEIANLSAWQRLNETHLAYFDDWAT